MLEEFEEALKAGNPDGVFRLIDERIASEIVRRELRRAVIDVARQIQRGDTGRPHAEILSDFIENITPEKEALCEQVINAEIILRRARGATPLPQTKKEFRDLVSAQNPLIPFSLRKFHLIHFIAQSDQSIEFAKILQEAGFDLAPTDHVGNTPLIWSIANASNRFAADFLDLAKANSLDIGIDKTDNYFAHNTALHLAVAKGYLTKDSEERPLTKTNHQLVDKIIDCGANPNIKNKYGMTALDLAVTRADPAMIRIICRSPLLTKETLDQALVYMVRDTWMNAESNGKILDRVTGSSFLPPSAESFNEATRNTLQNLLEARLLGQPPIETATSQTDLKKLAYDPSQVCTIS